MLDYIWAATLFFIISAAGMWVWVIARRALKARSPGRQPQRAAAGYSWILWSEAREPARLDAELAGLDPSAILETAAHVLPLVSGGDRDFIISALARANLDQYIDRNIRRAAEGQRLSCCEILGAMQGDRSSRILREALNDRAASVRIGAAISLAHRGELPPIAEILEQLGADARGSARLVQLFEELLSTRRDVVVNLAADRSGEPQVRISALQALAVNWDPGFIELADTVGEESPPAVAAAIARLIGERDLDEPGRAQILLRLLGSQSVVVRRAAVETAGAIPGSQIVRALGELLDDEDDLVRYAAARSLHQLRSVEAAVPNPVVPAGERETPPLEAA